MLAGNQGARNVRNYVKFVIFRLGRGEKKPFFQAFGRGALLSVSRGEKGPLLVSWDA